MSKDFIPFPFGDNHRKTPLFHGQSFTNPAMNPHIRFENVTVTYGPKTALEDVSLEIPENRIFAIIGPANSGKTTLLRCINRTIDFVPSAKVQGQVLIDGEDVFKIRNVYATAPPGGHGVSAAGRPAAVGLRERGLRPAPRRHPRPPELDEIVEKCLRQAMLWDEVKDRMNMLGTKLSGGQQQRLTLARALSLRPEILCLDEFSIAIDPVTTMRIEDICAS